MFSSDEPWAMATTLTPRAAERGERARRDAGTAAHAEADDGDQRDAVLGADAVDELRLALEQERLLERRHRVRRLGSSGSTKQMLASLDAWLIIDTECPACDSALNARPATPGTPIMPRAFDRDQRLAVDRR